LGGELEGFLVPPLVVAAALKKAGRYHLTTEN